MTKVLIIYANSDVTMRNSVSELLYSFQRHLVGCEVYYHNAIFNRAPLLRVFRNVDYVIFHHSVTTVWNRKRYRSKLQSWKRYQFYNAQMIALMQDEYKNVDLLRDFISQLSIDRVFTLAPQSEWLALYGQKLAQSGVLNQYLAGYLTSKLRFNSGEGRRDIDIGYRADWSKMHVKLGKLGLLKRDISFRVKDCAKEHDLETDIEIGEGHFIKGANWNQFLCRCRYVVGVPSGSSVLDLVGDIEKQLSQRISRESSITEDELYDNEVAASENSLKLEVLSPRHFEAMLNGCGQILIESEYNGILKPWVHYLPLKRDFSNIDEIIGLVPDESLRLKMVENCIQDIVLSNKFSYLSFVQLILPEMECLKSPSLNKSIWLSFNRLAESTKNLLLIVRSLLNMRPRV